MPVTPGIGWAEPRGPLHLARLRSVATVVPGLDSRARQTTFNGDYGDWQYPMTAWTLPPRTVPALEQVGATGGAILDGTEGSDALIKNPEPWSNTLYCLSPSCVLLPDPAAGLHTHHIIPTSSLILERPVGKTNLDRWQCSFSRLTSLYLGVPCRVALRSLYESRHSLSQSSGSDPDHSNTPQHPPTTLVLSLPTLLRTRIPRMAVGVESALKFLCKIKEVYGVGSPGYQGFLDIIRDFKAGR